MSLRALRTLVAIARHGTFARAADALGLTQSAVSLHVKALEQEFRAVLFDRSRRRPALTEAGRVALERAQAILAAYDGIAGELADGPGLRGRLRLGAIQSALSGRLPEALGRLKRLHPLLHVSVAGGMSAELALRVASGDLDAAITTEPVKPYPAGLAFAPIFSDRFWVVAPPGLEQADARELLTGRPFLRFDKRAWAGRMIEEELRRQGLRVSEETELDSQEALARMAASGLGVAVVPLADIDLARLPPMTRLPFGAPQLQRWMGLLEREEDAGQPVTVALASALRGSES